MNTAYDLLSRCLHDEAAADDWQLLDEQIAADPALAGRWCEVARLDGELSRLLSPPRSTIAPAWYMPAAFAAAAAAAAVVAGIFAAIPPAEPPAVSAPSVVATASEPAPPETTSVPDKDK